MSTQANAFTGYQGGFRAAPDLPLKADGEEECRLVYAFIDRFFCIFTPSLALGYHCRYRHVYYHIAVPLALCQLSRLLGAAYSGASSNFASTMSLAYMLIFVLAISISWDWVSHSKRYEERLLLLTQGHLLYVHPEAPARRVNTLDYFLALLTPMTAVALHSDKRLTALLFGVLSVFLEPVQNTDDRMFGLELASPQYAVAYLFLGLGAAYIVRRDGQRFSAASAAPGVLPYPSLPIQTPSSPVAFGTGVYSNQATVLSPSPAYTKN